MLTLFAATRTRPRFVRQPQAPLAAVALAALAGCAMPTHPDASAPPSDPFNPATIQLIDDTSWTLASWRDANGTARELPQGTGAIELTLSSADGVRRASGFSGCNRYTGTYSIKNGVLGFGPLAGTRMACPATAGGRLEPAYLGALAHLAKAGMQMREPQQLYLVTEDGATLTFTRRESGSH
ncbi:MAG: hypothetical protein GAK40_00985 [Burkholderia plantarii]|nr:MAG: hypothetical protein GAK40_00985 [Burkholderia plantarii]